MLTALKISVKFNSVYIYFFETHAKHTYTGRILSTQSYSIFFGLFKENKFVQVFKKMSNITLYETYRLPDFL